MSEKLRIGREGPFVFLVWESKAIRMPWNTALDVAASIREQAKQAEEYAKAEGIIFDQALLVRLGANIGLSSNPAIQAEAAKEAAWNSDLRRYLPGGVKSKEQFGAPSVIRHNPRKGDNHA